MMIYIFFCGEAVFKGFRIQSFCEVSEMEELI